MDEERPIAISYKENLLIEEALNMWAGNSPDNDEKNNKIEICERIIEKLHKVWGVGA